MGDISKEEKSCLMEKEEGEKLIGEGGGVSVLDFDMLCSTVAMQTHGKWRLFDNDDEYEGVDVNNGGVLRMWEGEVLDCFDDRRIALQSLCCPCYRFGKNMRRAGLGSCFLQGTIYLFLAVSAFLNCVAFAITRRHCFLYLAVAFTISLATYLGFIRTQIRKKFNIKGSESSLDDWVYHLICPCCTICQESRTLEMNNVQGGTWHGRGDTLCIGTFGESGKAFFDLRPPPPVSIAFDEPKLPLEKEGDGSDNC